ncbi:carbon-nitrogen hydrolase family protein [Mycobacterium xenopi 4042]|uniref:Carbon-nitrogen hydrolase family protein n=1 Tax=Mycobacterium xenopi 4042 TaxID=1299334 RepID=X8DMG4_MYCXE|nr:carbon-nitrogen hydrolase family protein [Mycobacterium xenopi 4042]
MTISVDGVDVGLTTCYDIRFPQLYVELARRGAQLITVSASWGAGPGKLEQWTLLAGPARSTPRATSPPRDRPTRAGPIPKRRWASAAAWWRPVRGGGGVDGAQPALVVADIDLDAVAAARDTIAVLQNQAAIPQVDKAESRG